MKSEEIKKMCRRVERIRNKQQLRDIYTIIKSNQNIDISENDNGCFILANLLNDTTLKYLNKYLQKNSL
jgi:hypothetical protein